MPRPRKLDTTDNPVPNTDNSTVVTSAGVEIVVTQGTNVLTPTEAPRPVPRKVTELPNGTIMEEY